MKLRNWLSVLVIMVLTLAALSVARAEQGVIVLNNVQEIKAQAFQGDQEIRKVVLREGIRTIESKAFADTGLLSINLPESLQSIAADAFSGCPSGLVAEVYEGSYAESYCKKYRISTIPIVRLKSGSDMMSKLSQAAINSLLAETEWSITGDVFEVEPSITVPYAPGVVKDEALIASLNRLNALRRIAGLPAVTLNQEKCEEAQYGAVVLARLNQLTHYPSQPEDMPDWFYEKGATATSSSNLYMNRAFVWAVDGFMDDSDSRNIDRVGHRRWQLNPRMSDVGFGYAEAQSNGWYSTVYFVEKVFSSSGSCEYDFIGWPASGNFPNSLFASHVAWSVGMNQSKYNYLKDDIEVTLVRQSDNKIWRFCTAEADGYFNVDFGGYGAIFNCIIFRPEGISSYTGKYTVQIRGMKKGGKPITMEYDVIFF